jgi:spore coat protein U-like protein
VNAHPKFFFLSMVGLAAAAIALSAGPAYAAGSATANLSVSASVARKCTIGTATLAFGSYDPLVANLTAPLTQSATMTVTCTKGAASITMGLGSSTGTDATFCALPARCLASGSNFLSYQLYSDSSYTNVWNAPIPEAVTGGVATPTIVTVYGRIPGAQDASVGAAYTDTIVATVNY